MSKRYPLCIDGLSRPLTMTTHESGDAVISKSIQSDGIWEAYETQLLMGLLSQGDVFLDIGANIGYYSLIGADCVGDTGNVVSFEPEVNNFKILQKNIEHYSFKQVQTVNMGLANQVGSSQLYLSEDNFGDHQLFPEDDSRLRQEIKLTRADDFFGELPQVNCIKMDVQGSEYEVVTGMKHLIARSLPNLSIITEFWPHGLTRAGSSAHKLLDELLSLEIPLYIIDHLNHHLISCTASDLRSWIDEVDNDPHNEGFMNLLLTHKNLSKTS